MEEKKYTSEWCSGCGLCHSVLNDKFYKDQKGFPYPKNIGSADFYEQVCPVHYYKTFNNNQIWGVVDKAYIGYSADEDIRFKAASGGALTEICTFLLQKKKVDAVIQVKEDENNTTATKVCFSRTAQEVKNNCGSRYSISVPLYSILQDVKEDERYAFVGKPCDVMALRNYIKTHDESMKQFPYLLSFFCAGEPSVDAQKTLLSALGTDIDQCKSIRYRGYGWPGRTTSITNNGIESSIEYKDAWGKYLGRDIRKLCRFCLDGTGELADIVCADFWQLNKDNYPDFSEHEGRNIIISRNRKSTEILEEMFHTNKLILESDFTGEMEDLKYYQPNHFKRKTMMKTQIHALKLLNKDVPVYDLRLIKAYSQKQSLKSRFKFFVGTIKRAIRGRI